MPEDMALFGQEQDIPSEQGGIPQDAGMALFEEGQGDSFQQMTERSPMFGAQEDDFMSKNGSEPIPYERLMMYIEQVLSQSPEAAQDIMDRIQQSGLSVEDIENLGALSAISLANPDMYPALSKTMKSMFPELNETITEDIEDDGPMLVEFVAAAKVNEGGII